MIAGGSGGVRRPAGGIPGPEAGTGEGQQKEGKIDEDYGGPRGQVEDKGDGDTSQHGEDAGEAGDYDRRPEPPGELQRRHGGMMSSAETSMIPTTLMARTTVRAVRRTRMRLMRSVRMPDVLADSSSKVMARSSW